MEPAHLQAYLNEFAFRFNRRNSRSRGLVFYRVLELATGHDPVRYDDIRAARKPRSKPPQQRGTGHPPSLNRPAAARPWRTAEMQLQFPTPLKWIPRQPFHPGGWSRRVKSRLVRVAAGRGRCRAEDWAAGMRRAMVDAGCLCTPAFCGMRTRFTAWRRGLDLRVAHCCLEHAGQYSGPGARRP